MECRPYPFYDSNFLAETIFGYMHFGPWESCLKILKQKCENNVFSAYHRHFDALRWGILTAGVFWMHAFIWRFHLHVSHFRSHPFFPTGSIQLPSSSCLHPAPFLLPPLSSSLPPASFLQFPPSSSLLSAPPFSSLPPAPSFQLPPFSYLPSAPLFQLPYFSSLSSAPPFFHLPPSLGQLFPSSSLPFVNLHTYDRQIHWYTILKFSLKCSHAVRNGCDQKCFHENWITKWMPAFDFRIKIS